MSAMTSGADTAPKSEQAKQAMSTAAEKASGVAAEASEQVRNVAQEAKQQARELADRTRDDVRVQAQERSQQLAGSMRSLADRLGSLADGNTSDAGPLLEYLREGQYRINEWAGRLDDGPDAVFDEMRSLARRKPMMFLAGAGVLGFFAGRMVRAAAGNDENGADGASVSAPVVATPAAVTRPSPVIEPATMPPAATSPPAGSPPVAPLGTETPLGDSPGVMPR